MLKSEANLTGQTTDATMTSMKSQVEYERFWVRKTTLHKLLGSGGGAVVRALASHQCGPGPIPGPGVISGLSLLLVLVLAPRVFLRVLRFSSLHKN